MKKAFLLALFFVPFVSFAQTTAMNQGQILALLNILTQEVQMLEARLTALENQPTFGSVMADNQATYQNAINDEAAVEYSIDAACTVPNNSALTLTEAAPICTSAAAQVQARKTKDIQIETSLQNEVPQPNVVSTTTPFRYHVGDMLLDPITGKRTGTVANVGSYGEIDCTYYSGPNDKSCGG